MLTGSRPPPHGLDRGVAVVGVEQDAVGQDLDPLRQIGDLAGHALALARAEPQLDHLAGRSSASIRSRGEPSAAIRPWSMTTRRSHSCSASSM